MQNLKKISILLLILTLILPSLTFANTITDDSRIAVDILKAAKILTGDATGNVNENQPLKREELVAILVRMADATYDGSFKKPATASFKDVPTTHWAFEIVEKAKHYKLTTGIGNGMFGIGQQVTYQQALTFVTRMVGYNFDWNTVISDARFNGFSSAEPAIGMPFLRGHMFDLTVRALKEYDFNTGEIWGKHIADSLSTTHPEYVEILNSFQSLKSYVSPAFKATAWGNSKLAKASELTTRFDASKVTWTEADKSVLASLEFGVRLTDIEYGENLWRITYDSDLKVITGLFRGAGYGGFMETITDKVYTNDTLQFNGQPVKTFLITGFYNNGYGSEPYRIVVQTINGKFVNGWWDSITTSKNLEPAPIYGDF